MQLAEHAGRMGRQSQHQCIPSARLLNLKRGEIVRRLFGHSATFIKIERVGSS
jgi:hypothetical protein